MIKFCSLAESKTPPLILLDIKSEIKWMEVLKSISLKKIFFLGSLPQVPARVHVIQLFFGIVSTHGNVDSHEYTLL